jgi:hypothetical protein
MICKYLTTCFVLVSALIYSGESRNEKKSDRNEVISTNVSYVKNNITNKIQAAEEKLEEYKTNLNNSEDESESKRWLKKIQKTEIKIKSLNESLLGIQVAETKLSK